jgi:hypothetical protein
MREEHVIPVMIDRIKALLGEGQEVEAPASDSRGAGAGSDSTG